MMFTYTQGQLVQGYLGDGIADPLAEDLELRVMVQVIQLGGVVHELFIAAHTNIQTSTLVGVVS